MSIDNHLIEKYLEGTCSNDELHQILSWMDEAEGNDKELFNLKLIAAQQEYDRRSEPGQTERAYHELMRLNRYKEELELTLTRKISLRFMQYAASVLLLIGLATGAWQIADYLEKEATLISVVVEKDEAIRQITLADNTQVWLFENSRIDYPEKFGKHERLVRVEGKVYFEVAKDKTRPFYVDIDGYKVEALGTAFEITRYKDQAVFEVTLVEGSVQVSNMNDQILSVLQPNQQLSYNLGSHKLEVKKVNADIYTSWINGVLEFDGMTFPEIAKVLERIYNVKIVLEHPDSMTQHLVGSLSLKKDIASMMKAIEIVVPISYNIEIDTYVYIQSQPGKQ